MIPAIGSRWYMYVAAKLPLHIRVRVVETAFVLIEFIDEPVDQWHCHRREWISRSIFGVGGSVVPE